MKLRKILFLVTLLGVPALGALTQVDNSMLNSMPTSRLKGRVTGGTGEVEDLTATQATTILNDFVGDSGSGGTKGLVPAPAAGDANKVLKGDGSWGSPAGLGYADINGQSAITAIDNDDSILVADTSATSLKKVTFADFRKNLYRSVTTTDSPTQSDQLLVLSGASFTVTLPTAASLAGKEFEILHNGTSVTQVYTLNTTSSQTIGGVASGSYKLTTNGEKLRIVSDGSNWVILEHKTDTGWIAFTPSWTNMGFTVFSVNAGFWRREKDSIRVRAYFDPTTGTGSGSQLQMALPLSLTMDSAKMEGGGSGKGALGHYDFWDDSGGTSKLTGIVAIQTSTTIGMIAVTGGVSSFTTSLMNNTGDAFSFEFVAPVTDWQP